jgi:hypothetical protein
MKYGQYKCRNSKGAPGQYQMSFKRKPWQDERQRTRDHSGDQQPPNDHSPQSSRAPTHASVAFCALEMETAAIPMIAAINAA